VPAYQYPAAAANVQPVQRQYRSADRTPSTAQQPYLTFDSGYAYVGIDSQGFAIFGNNAPRLQVLWSDFSDFSVYDSVTIGVPMVNVGLTLDCSLWSADSDDYTAFAISANGRTMTILADGASPGWRKHQFYSHESGVQHYVCISGGYSAGQASVCRILDNTENSLYLEETALTVLSGLLSGERQVVSIYSDRWAIRRPGNVYQYARIDTTVIDLSAFPISVTYFPSTKDYWQVGRVIMGEWLDLSDPAVDWGWSIKHTGGFNVQRNETGAAFAKKRSTPLRQVTASFDFLQHDLRTTDTRVLSATKTWEEVVEAMRRLEFEGRPCALVWETNDPTNALRWSGEPASILCGRVAVGDSTHVMYKAASGAEGVCVPRPIMSLSALTFTEED